MELLRSIVSGGSPFQHSAVNMMGKIVRKEISDRNSGKEKHTPKYHENTTVQIVFQTGEIIVIRFGLYGGYCSISSSLTIRQINRELAKQLPEWEIRNRFPDTFPDGWKKENITHFHRKLSDNEDWYVWARCDSQQSGDDLYSLNWRAELIRYYISDGFTILTGKEIPLQWGEDCSRTVRTYLSSGEKPPKWLNEFFVRLTLEIFKGKKVIAISLKPYTFKTIYTRVESDAQKDFRLAETCRTLYLSNGEISETMEEKTVDHSNCKNGTFLFQIDTNIYGVLEDRNGFRYLLPYTFQKIQFYPDGLPVENLAEEIEKARVM